MAFENLVELYEQSCSDHASRPVFGSKGAGGWSWVTYRELLDLISEFRGGLHALGVGAGDRVAIVSNNRLEWAVAAYATYGLEGVFVPMYEAQRPEDWEFILADSSASVVIGSGPAVVAALDSMQRRLPALKHVIALDAPESDPRSYLALRALGRSAPVAARYPDSEATAGFVYTSGTTGQPKGVMLSHANITSNIQSVRSVFPVASDDRTLAFLPWAHVYGQVVEMHVVVSAGASIAINDDVSRLLSNLGEVQPTMLVAVPRIFNKLYAAVLHQMEARPRPLRALFRAGLECAALKQRGVGLGPLRAAAYAVANRLIFRKIRGRFGGRLKYLISGSAALSSEVAEFIDRVGLEVYEGYGLTETSPIVSANRPGARKLGSVGLPIPGVRIEIDEIVGLEPGAGEVVVYGPNVMQGYHERPDETAKVLQADGGLRTGDLGRLDQDGYLWITGRIKEQYKLENGKYVTPSLLEEELKLSPYIANVMLHGANEAFNVAVVVLNRDALREWAELKGVTLGDALVNPVVRSLVQDELARRSARFRAFERPRDFVLTLDDFTAENGMLTPTLKLKRHAVLERYREALDRLHAASGRDAEAAPALGSTGAP